MASCLASITSVHNTDTAVQVAVSQIVEVIALKSSFFYFLSFIYAKRKSEFLLQTDTLAFESGANDVGGAEIWGRLTGQTGIW